MLKTIFLVCFLLGFCAIAPAELRVASIFTDDMVLQRDAEAKVWGWDQPGTKVTVSFAGQSTEAIASADGKWQVGLARLAVDSKGKNLNISSPNGNLTLKNVLVGDVWLCAGQSNMAMTIPKNEEGKKAIAAADFPNVRFYNVKEALAPDKKSDLILASKWRIVSPQSAGELSAVAFFFARTMQEKQQVPVGLIISAWPGAQIITWIPPESLNKSLYDNKDPAEETRYAQLWRDKNMHEAKKTTLQEMAQSSNPAFKQWAEAKLYWRPLHYFPGWTFNAKIYPIAPMALKGVIWYQGEENHYMGMKYKDYLVCLAQSWRETFHQDLPFYVVMLPPFGYPRQNMLPSFWMAQLAAVKTMGNAAAICTLDLGDFKDIHPQIKEPLGIRVAAAVSKHSFNAGGTSPGPQFKTVSFDGSRADLTFSDTAQGLKGAAELPGFELAGADRKFVAAKAMITGSDKVSVVCEQIAKPEWVRYAWSNTPVVGLFNSEGLPVLPFSTENN